MRKTFALILSLAMAVFMVACGSEEASPKQQEALALLSEATTARTELEQLAADTGYSISGENYATFKKLSAAIDSYVEPLEEKSLPDETLDKAITELTAAIEWMNSQKIIVEKAQSAEISDDMQWLRTDSV